MSEVQHNSRIDEGVSNAFNQYCKVYGKQKNIENQEALILHMLVNTNQDVRERINEILKDSTLKIQPPKDDTLSLVVKNWEQLIPNLNRLEVSEFEAYQRKIGVTT